MATQYLVSATRISASRTRFNTVASRWSSPGRRKCRARIKLANPFFYRRDNELSSASRWSLVSEPVLQMGLIKIDQRLGRYCEPGVSDCTLYTGNATTRAYPRTNYNY